MAAKIIYSNLQLSGNRPSSNINNISDNSKIKRPSSLTKSCLSSSPTSSNYTDISESTNKYQNARQKFYSSSQQQQSLKTQLDTTNDYDFFPSPPSSIKQIDQPNASHRGLLRPVQNDEKQQQNKCIIPIIPYAHQTTVDEPRRTKPAKIFYEESYCILKELVMTERTYKKNLDLLTESFREHALANNFDLNEISLFNNMLYSEALDPINQFHYVFLKELELLLYNWFDKPSKSAPAEADKNELEQPPQQQHHQQQKIGHILLKLEKVIKQYRFYIEKYEEILCELEQACKRNKKFDCLLREFENLKICYLPFIMFLLKPLQRVISYKILVESKFFDIYNMI